jgi:hypothetical protein
MFLSGPKNFTNQEQKGALVGKAEVSWAIVK